MRILLIQPTIPSISKGVSGTISLEPLALELIAAPVLATHEVKIIDLKIDPHIEKIVTSFQPDIVGLTAYTMEVPEALRLAEIVKTLLPVSVLVIGGLHATMFPETFKSSPFDYLVRGRGEYRFKKLVDFLENPSSPTPCDDTIINLSSWSSELDPEATLWEEQDSSLIPARETVKEYRRFYHLGLMDNCYSIKSSDGCPHQCSFCIVWKYYQGRYQSRTAEDVVREIESVPGQNIIMVDDNFLYNTRRSRKIARLIKEKKIVKRYFIQSRPDTIIRNKELIQEWKDVGLSLVALGMDGFRSRELEQWNKKSDPEDGIKATEILNDLGIQTLGEFIIDTDFDKRDFRLLSRYIRRVKPTLVQLSILTPLPGTALYEERKNDLISTDLSHFNIDYPVVRTRLPLSIFFNCIANLYWSTYCYPPSVYRRLKLGGYSVKQSIMGFKLISSIITHYKMQSWRAWRTHQ